MATSFSTVVQNRNSFSRVCLSGKRQPKGLDLSCWEMKEKEAGGVEGCTLPVLYSEFYPSLVVTAHVVNIVCIWCMGWEYIYSV